MTWNGHFALKSVFGSASHGFACSDWDKTTRKLAELCTYCLR